MPSNERINKRKEQQRKKERKTKITVWIILFVIFFAMIIMKVCEIDFNSIKNAFSQEASVSSSGYYPYTSNGDNAQLDIVNNKFVVFTDSAVDVLNIQNAKKLYSFEHGYASPAKAYSSNYICVYDRAGTRLRLDSLSKNLYELSLNKPIITAAVADNGVVAYSTFSDSSKSKIVILSKNRNTKAEFEISDGYVTCIALNSNASKCAYVTVNSENGEFISTVHTVSVASNEEIAKFDYNNSDILNLKYGAYDRMYVVGVDFLSVIKGQKEQIQVFEKGSITTLNYCFTNDDELVLNYSEYSNSQSTVISYVKSNGKVKTSINTDSEPKYLSTYENKIAVLYPNSFSVYSLTNGELKQTLACDSYINSVHCVSSKSYVQYGQNVDVIEAQTKGDE